MNMSVEEYRQYMAKRGQSAISEHELQKQCVSWFRYTHSEYAKLLLAIPNGARRTKFERVQVLEEGLQAGTPDLFLAIPRHKMHGLWIEMKNGKAGRVSDRQNDMLSRLLEQGYECRIARSFDDFEQIVTEYLK